MSSWLLDALVLFFKFFDRGEQGVVFGLVKAFDPPNVQFFLRKCWAYCCDQAGRNHCASQPSFQFHLLSPYVGNARLVKPWCYRMMIERGKNAELPAFLG